MLCYKAWRESQARFLLSALAIVGLCVAFVVFHRQGILIATEEHLTYIGYIWRIVYKSYLRELFAILVLLLGVGGLLRERAYGTAGFTLALPVSRSRLVLTRAAIGFLEVAALSFLPALVIPALSPLVHQSYPWRQALQFGALWTVGGALIFTMGFLASVLFASEYSAPIAALLILLSYSEIADLPFLARYPVDIHDIMSGVGMPYFQPHTSLLTGPLPWTALAVISLIACGLIALAGCIGRRRDF